MSIFIAQDYKKPLTIKSKSLFRKNVVNIPTRLNNARKNWKHKIENGRKNSFVSLQHFHPEF